MSIRTRMCMSVDGYVSTPDGRPVQLADPDWSPEAYGFREFQAACDGRADGPHPRPGCYRQRPGATAAQGARGNQGGDVHLVGGPRTIEAFRQLGVLDLLGLIVLPVLVGAGMRFTPALSLDTTLTVEPERRLPTGAVEIVYACA